MEGNMSETFSLLSNASATEVAALIRSGEVSSVQVTEACLARVEELDSTYRSYLMLLKDQALELARQADADVRKRAHLGPLHGVPVNVKDVFLIRGTPTTAGSTLLRDFSPDDREDATCVQRLRRAGAIILGKVNVATGMVGANPDNTRLVFSRNPWCPERDAGGSSSGSAVSVALGMGYASVGTDLGGSIRIPAAWVGVVGLKPTYGCVSQYGDVFSLCRTLEHVGPITRTVRDAALVLNVLAGYDPKDPTSVDRPIPDLMSSLEDGLRNKVLRLGWAADGGPMGAEPEVLTRVEAGVRLLAESGVVVEEIDLPPFSEELWYQLTLLDEWEAYDAEKGEATPYSAYIQARLRRNRRRVLDQIAVQVAHVRKVYQMLFERFDLLALPTTPIVAKPFDVRTVPWGESERDVLHLFVSNTWMFNLTGHPAISLPCGFDSNSLPIGLQIVGRHFEEATVLRVAATFEQVSGRFAMPQV